MWQYLAALLMSLSHDPQAGNAEPPRAAAAVAAAYAGLCVDISPPPAPAPAPGGGCGACKCTGAVRMPDGHLVECPCPVGCKCHAFKGASDALPATAPPSSLRARR